MERLNPIQMQSYLEIYSHFSSLVTTCSLARNRIGFYVKDLSIIGNAAFKHAKVQVMDEFRVGWGRGVSGRDSPYMPFDGTSSYWNNDGYVSSNSSSLALYDHILT